jgi:hypothetical protein
MAKFVPGTTVFRSALSLDKKAELDHVLVEGQVVSVSGRSATVDFRNSIGQKTVGTVSLHLHVSFLLIEIGDFGNETANLDPLAQSIQTFLRLLISDSSLVKFIKIRSSGELEYALEHYGSYSHIIFVGHGSKKGNLHAGSHEKISSQSFADMIAMFCKSKPTFISMCCHSGEAAFAKRVSNTIECGAFIAPKGAIHSCSASQFVQTFLGFHILEGMRLKSAFDRARECTPGSAALRMWKNGVIQ